ARADGNVKRSPLSKWISDNCREQRYHEWECGVRDIESASIEGSEMARLTSGVPEVRRLLRQAWGRRDTSEVYACEWWRSPRVRYRSGENDFSPDDSRMRQARDEAYGSRCPARPGSARGER